MAQNVFQTTITTTKGTTAATATTEAARM